MNSYNKIGWVNGSEPPISAENLNHMDDGIEAVNEAVSALELDVSGDKTDLEALITEIQNARGTSQNLAEKLATFLTLSDVSNKLNFDITTTDIPYSVNNYKTVYLRAKVDNEFGIVFTGYSTGAQFFLGRNGSIKLRVPQGNYYGSWTVIAEKAANKKNSITNANRQSTTYYPTIKAVVDYVTLAIANGGNSGGNVDISGVIEMLDNKADKSTTLAGYGIANAYTKAEVDDILNIEDGEGTLTCRDTSWLTESTYYYHRMGDFVDVTGQIYFDHTVPIEYETDPDTGDTILDEETGDPVIKYPRILNLRFDGLPYVCRSSFSINSTTFLRPTGNVTAINVVAGTASILVSDVFRRNKEVFDDVLTFQIRYKVED